MKLETITILGLNRVTGSLATAWRRSLTDVTVQAYDAFYDVAREAKAGDMVDKIARGARGLVRDSDLILLSVPLRELEPLLDGIADQISEDAIIFDLSTLKQPGFKLASKYIPDAVNRFVGITPMARNDSLADVREGVAAADVDMFSGGVFAIVASPETTQLALSAAEQLGQAAGAAPYFVDMMEYDALVQGVEVMPSLLAAALMKTTTDSASWQDIARLANHRFSLATLPLESHKDLVDILAANRLSALAWLDSTINNLVNLRRQVKEREQEALRSQLGDLAQARAIWLRRRERNAWGKQENEIDNEITGFIPQLFGGGRVRPKTSDDE